MKPNFESINAICPIYAASDRERPNLIGTGTLLDFGTARFLVTAAHVHDEYTENQVALYVATDGPLLELPHPFHTTVVPPSGKRDDDRLDFAFLRLPDSLADEIAKGRFFLPFSLVDANDRLKPRARYMFTGFPGSREKTNYGEKKMKPQRFSFTGETVSPKRMLALGIAAETHIAVEFDREQAFDEQGVIHIYGSLTLLCAWSASELKTRIAGGFGKAGATLGVFSASLMELQNATDKLAYCGSSGKPRWTPNSSRAERWWNT